MTDDRIKIITKRIKKWFDGHNPGPYQVEINPTDKCNLDCLPCFVRGKANYEPEKELTEERYLEIISNASEMGVKFWNISGGGEPFSKPDLTMNIIEKIREEGMNGCVSTNGVYFSEDMIEKIIDIGWERVIVSINAPDKITDDFLRGGDGVFNRTISNLEMFQKIKKEKNSNKPEIHIAPVLVSENYEMLSEFVNFCDKYNIDSLRLQPFMSSLLPRRQPGPEDIRQNWGKKLSIDELDKDVLFEEIEEAIKLSQKLGVSCNLASIKQEFTDNKETETIDNNKEDENEIRCIEDIPCYYPWYSLHIDSHGNTSQCPKKPVKHNIKNYNTKEIWYSDKFDELRRNISCDYLANKCNYCCPILENDNQEIRSYMSKNFKDQDLRINPRLLEFWEKNIRLENQLDELKKEYNEAEKKLKNVFE